MTFRFSFNVSIEKKSYCQKIYRGFSLSRRFSHLLMKLQCCFELVDSTFEAFALSFPLGPASHHLADHNIEPDKYNKHCIQYKTYIYPKKTLFLLPMATLVYHLLYYTCVITEPLIGPLLLVSCRLHQQSFKNPYQPWYTESRIPQ